MRKWRKADFMKDWKSGWNHVGIKQFWCLGPRAGTVASCQFLKVNPKLIYQNKFDLFFNIGIFNIGRARSSVVVQQVVLSAQWLSSFKWMQGNESNSKPFPRV